MSYSRESFHSLAVGPGFVRISDLHASTLSHLLDDGYDKRG